MSNGPVPNPTTRDRSVRRVRLAAWGTGAVAAGLTVVFSVVAAHAFKGHRTGAASAAGTPVARKTQPRVSVPPAQRVPAITGAPAPIQPPAQPPAAAPAAAQPAATSGGS